jgi:hypothetical protein
MQTSISRFPRRAELLPVYAILLFLSGSWALYRFAWYLPSWMEYLSLSSVLVIAAYTLGYVLLESGVILGLVVLAGLAFPRPVFRSQFVAQGSTLALALGAGAALVQRQVSMIYRWEVWQVLTYSGAVLVAAVLLILLAAWLYRRFPRLLRLVNAFAERMTVFAYIYVPLGIIGLAVVVIRNLIG